MTQVISPVFINNVLGRAVAAEAGWEKWMLENTGYQRKSTFYMDFTIAELCGNPVHDVLDTYRRAFYGWKHDIEYIAELYMVLATKVNVWFEKNEPLYEAYHKCYEALWSYVYGHDEDGNPNYSEEDRTTFFNITD